MMTEAIETGAAVTPLPIAANVDAAWARYTALVAQSVADPALLTDRDHCSACIRAWATFRDLMIASDSLSAETPVLPLDAAAPALTSGTLVQA